MKIRKKLPNRRGVVTTTLEYGNSQFTVSVGFHQETGEIAEVFVDGTKGELEGIIDDACVAISLLFQFGLNPQEVVERFGGTPQDPASVIGRIAYLICDIESRMLKDKLQ